MRVRPHWLLIGDGFQRVVGDAEPIRLGRGASSLGEALRESAALWPGADVLLLTDGRATDGDDLGAARAVAAAGGRVFVAPPARPAADVGMLQARILSAAPEVQILAQIDASTAGSGEIRLSRLGKVIDRVRLDFHPGQGQEVTLRDANPPPGGASYRLVLVAEPGTPNDDAGNDTLSVALRPQPRVVLTWGLEEAALGFAGPDLVVRRVEEAGPDTDPGDLAAADCLVMANLPFADVGTEAGDAIEHFVASGGCLLILGGPSAYAGGGWTGTRFEKRVSPLRVPREEGTGLALVLAVDRSGSTAGTTLAHLQEAVRRALQGIVPGERMAVLPFARRPMDTWLKPGIVESAVESAAESTRIAELLDAVDALEPGGETDLVLAINEAVRRVKDIPARTRRVILLTDGDPDQPLDVGALRAAGLRAREAEVEVAALVVGDPAAVKILRETVATRLDHVQALEDPQALPARLLHWLGGVRGEKAERPIPDRLAFVPGAFDGGGAFDGFLPRTVEHLEVATDAGAQALIFAEYEDLPPPKDRVPFMAQRRVGAGQVVGLAWGPVWEKRREREAALMRLKSWVALLASSSDRGLAAEVRGEELTLRYPGAAGTGGLKARSARSFSTLVEVEPGLFRGPLPEASEGGVWVSAASEGPGSTVPAQERPLRLPSRPAAESQGVGLDLVRMAALAEAGGGQCLEPGVQPPRPVRDRGGPLAPWLLLVACALLLLDRLWSKPLGLTTDS